MDGFATFTGCIAYLSLNKKRFNEKLNSLFYIRVFLGNFFCRLNKLVCFYILQQITPHVFQMTEKCPYSQVGILENGMCELVDMNPCGNQWTPCGCATSVRRTAQQG